MIHLKVNLVLKIAKNEDFIPRSSVNRSDFPYKMPVGSDPSTLRPLLAENGLS
jgi:hypothetical protein